MTNYQRGTRFERSLMKDLNEQGYDTLRTAGSHGAFDVVAFNSDCVIFIQCKVEKTSPTSIISKYKKYKSDIDRIGLTKLPKHAIVKELTVKVDRKKPETFLVI